MRNGAVFRQLVRNCAPLQILGTVNAYCALLAERAGAKAIYLSGSGVATASHGLPDLGITNLFDVVEDSRRITSVSKLPLLVDIDTGFGDVLGIARTIQALERAQVAAVHIEDQVSNAKRCGHRPGKNIVSTEEMCKRIRAAVDSRSDPEFVVMARTDALAAEGIDGSLKRCEAYINAGADMLFIEACTTLDQYKLFPKQFPEVPILANMTEFGKTPIYSLDEFKSVGLSMVLYPLSAHRVMSKAALETFTSIIQTGDQRQMLSKMQTREESYSILNYHAYETRQNQL